MSVSKTSENLGQAPVVRMQDRGIRWFGYFVILLMFGGLGGWSAYAMIDSAAVAPGVVTVESYRQAVQHLEGGIVSDLTVREGDLVEAGDLVARLDETQFSAQLEAVRSELGGLLALEARLEAERDGRAEIVFPPELMDRAAADSRLGEFMDTQRQVFQARGADLEARIALLNQGIEELRDQIRGYDDQEATFVRRTELYEDELQGLRDLFEQGMGDKVRMRALERDLAEVQGDLAAVRSERSRARLQIDETALQIAQVQHEYHREVVTELSSVQERLFDAQERRRGLEDRVERTWLRAPASGRVVDLDVHTVGAVLSPGGRLMDIVPADVELVIDAQVAPEDIDKVFPGLEARIRLTAFNFRSTPTIFGRVETVSADRLIDDQAGHAYYLARIQVSDEELGRLNGLELLPGMPAEVLIVTGERTLLDYLLRPLTDGLARSLRGD